MSTIAEYILNASELKQAATYLKAGDRVILSGEVFTARDAAHKRFIELLKNNKPLPIDIRNATIYYAGPTPTPNHLSIGSCGPTTSGRMDSFVEPLMQHGLIAMIGKGERNESVIDTIAKYNGVYLCAIGGAGALAAKCVTSCEIVAFEDLGCESVKRLVLKEFPLVVAVDSFRNNIFHTGREFYKK